MKYSLFTVSVPEMTLEQALKKMKEYGYDGVDWRVTDISDNPEILKESPSYWRNNYCTVDMKTVDEKAEELKALSDRYGISVNALATYLKCTDREEDIERCMTAAKKMGCGRIRVNAPSYDQTRTYNQLYEEAVAGFKKVEALAKKHGVKADFEMHMRTITPSASAALRIASNFDSRYIGVIYDTGNVIYEGYEEYKMAFEILGPYLDLVHIKNAHWIKKEVDGKEKFIPDWASFQDGFADFERCFKALKAVGYDGFITFEDFSDAKSSEEKLKTDISYIKSIVESIK
ncbi:MAG: sugar phosphate isomerase/epimerase [Hungatella sp.]|nr:sugar phosphate isomerase/epimerase [Hungatella sp.]